MAGDFPKRQSYALDDDTPSAKRRRLDSKILQLVERSDRITNLPQELLYCILERLSVRDAARTSVLSKQWRRKWGMKNNLVLDKLFFSQLTSKKDKDTHQSAFSRAVEMITLVHQGPLFNFHLYIPPKLDHCTLSRWLQHFLNKRIRVLQIVFSEKNAHEIPLFACEGLVELKLARWILTPLPELRSFANLIRVTLVDISFTADISFGSQLKALFLHGCTGIQHLGSQFTNANNLTDLHLRKSEQIKWQWFESTKQLQVLFLSLTATKPNTPMPVNLIKLLGNAPSISKLYLCGYTVEVLGPFHSMLKGLAPQTKDLALCGLGFHNLCQISNSLSLIRCLPNLQILAIALIPGVESLNPTDGQRMELHRCKHVLLHQLQSVDHLKSYMEKSKLKKESLKLSQKESDRFNPVYAFPGDTVILVGFSIYLEAFIYNEGSHKLCGYHEAVR
ncbi:hypothetical protein POM88_033744 [Heracleum sosnowskyi]|uniref:F-box domain-containing protein n=1 Tax=Heracleum sosnowskyi TaxID=360622 RepID=A0AAD8MCD6_9APIA|nr:hypothetical protein POM88_033744 [Heracleum sosnowskyi]